MPKPGDYFVIGAGTHPAALVIETFTGSLYYHAGIYVGNGTVIEAQPEGVNYAPVNSWANGRILWSCEELSDAQREAIVTSAKAALGTPYSWLDILALGLSAWGITPSWVWARLSRQDRLICSQLVARCYQNAGVDLCPGKPDSRITPGDLADVILGKPVPENR